MVSPPIPALVLAALALALAQTGPGTPPVVTASRTTNGATGDPLVVAGQAFSTAPGAISVSIGDDTLAIVASNSSQSLKAQLEGGPAPVHGPIIVANGKRHTVGPGPFGQHPSLPSVEGLSVFRGPQPVVASEPPPVWFDLGPSPQLTAFAPVPWSGPGQRYRLPLDAWQAGTTLRFWLRLRSNGRLYDAYWTGPSGPTGSVEVTVPTAMSAQWAAIWTAAWMQTALGPTVDGLVCDVVDGAVLVSVSTGGGIAQLAGGYVVHQP